MKTDNASMNLFEMDLAIQTEHLMVDVIWCRVMEKHKEWTIMKHKHHSFEFHICKSGSSFVTLDHEKILLKENQMMITGPGVYHTQEQGVDNDYVEYALNCNITLLGDESSEGMALFLALQQGNVHIYSARTLIPLFEEILLEATEKKIGYYNKIKCLLNLMLIESSRLILKEKVIYDEPKKMSVHDRRYHVIYRLILDHVLNPLSLNEIAEKLHLSDRQINRIVGANAKMSTKQLMNEVRFNVLKEYLLNTDWSIQEISDHMNFSSIYYLNEFFKRYENLPPSQFRKMSKNLK